MFSIPFSGQADSFAEDDDDLFGDGASQQAGPFSAAAPLQPAVGPESSFSFDDFGEEQKQQQQNGPPFSNQAQSQAQHPYVSQNHGIFPFPYASQLPMQQHQTQQLSAANQALPQANLSQPLWPQHDAQTYANGPKHFTAQPASLASSLRPSTYGEVSSASASLPAQQKLNFPSASSSLPFQQVITPPSGLPFGQAALPQLGPTPAPLPLQLPGGPLAVSTLRVPSPPPDDVAASHAQQSPYSNDAAWNGTVKRLLLACHLTEMYRGHIFIILPVALLSHCTHCKAILGEGAAADTRCNIFSAGECRHAVVNASNGVFCTCQHNARSATSHTF